MIFINVWYLSGQIGATSHSNNSVMLSTIWNTNMKSKYCNLLTWHRYLPLHPQSLYYSISCTQLILLLIGTQGRLGKHFQRVSTKHFTPPFLLLLFLQKPPVARPESVNIPEGLSRQSKRQKSRWQHSYCNGFIILIPGASFWFWRSLWWDFQVTSYFSMVNQI
jgi:hypothetical protein